MADSRRDAALLLADEILADIELSRISPQQIANKASRLARLVDDHEAMEWLRYEVAGYPHGTLDETARRAGRRSQRHVAHQPGEEYSGRVYTPSLGALEVDRDGAKARISNNPPSFAGEGSRANLHSWRIDQRAVADHAHFIQRIIDGIVGAIHNYVSGVHHTLQFGMAVETAFETVRADVDSKIGTLVPNLPRMLASAWENAASNNPEDWAAAAGTCRRAIKAVADTLRPPGEPVDGHGMTDAQYKNRLLDWIHSNSESNTERALIESELEHLNARLDAVVDTGHKGAHDNVSREQASRFLVSTYLLLGDILRVGA